MKAERISFIRVQVSLASIIYFKNNFSLSYATRTMC